MTCCGEAAVDLVADESGRTGHQYGEGLGIHVSAQGVNRPRERAHAMTVLRSGRKRDRLFPLLRASSPQGNRSILPGKETRRNPKPASPPMRFGFRRVLFCLIQPARSPRPGKPGKRRGSRRVVSNENWQGYCAPALCVNRHAPMNGHARSPRLQTERWLSVAIGQIGLQVLTGLVMLLPVWFSGTDLLEQHGVVLHSLLLTQQSEATAGELVPFE